MKLRRALFLLLAVLMLLATLLSCTLALRIDQVYREIACFSALRLRPGTTCDPGPARPKQLLLLAMGIIGGGLALSFGWLAWQETLILRRKRRRDTQRHLFEQSDLILHTGPPPPDDE